MTNKNNMQNNSETGSRIKYLVYLHLCILLFSMTEVTGKFAAIQFKESGFKSAYFYLLMALMLSICVIYAFCWQKIIRYFDLHVAYANRAVYLGWSQIWASAIFSEHITPRNLIGMLVVMTGVVIVSTDNQPDNESEVN